MMNSSSEELSREEGGAADVGDAAIEIRDLSVRRGGKVILPGVWLRVHPGRVTGLLGPSGSGKTTLMRAIVGVQFVEHGEVSVLGQPAGTPALRRRVAYVTQAPPSTPTSPSRRTCATSRSSSARRGGGLRR
jgi:ABC-2 type transport system ATP-binding protein